MKFKLIKFFTITLFFVFLIVACYYDSEENLYPQLESNCDTTIFTFSGAVKPILRDNCYLCHSNANSGFGNNIKLEDFNDVKVMVDNGKLIGSITHQGGFSRMPKDGAKLSDCKIKLIQKWIDNNALNN
jgi:hypothetical protein